VPRQTVTNAFTHLPVAAILAVGLMALARGVNLYRRGIQAVVNDPQRSLAEKVFEASTFFLLVFWVYLIINYADDRGPRWLPDRLDHAMMNEQPLKWLGGGLLAAGVVLYALALRAMGHSWRMGIDRSAHDPKAAAPTASLVTHGVFARSRNPIYLGFNLLFLGSFLIHGQVVLLLTGLALALCFHVQILREERFLAGCYGERFADYRRRVRRYI